MADKYGIFINDDEDPLWESGVDASDVDQIVVTNARGEVTTIGSHGGDVWLRIRVNERPQVETYLDQIERRKLDERRELFEQTPEDMSAHVSADPETGEPMTDSADEVPAERQGEDGAVSVGASSDESTDLSEF